MDGLFDHYVDKPPRPKKQKSEEKCAPYIITPEENKKLKSNAFDHFTKKAQDNIDPELKERLAKEAKRKRLSISALAWHTKMYNSDEEYRKKHIADSTAYYEDNKPRILARMKKKYDENPEHYRDLSRENRRKNGDKINARRRAKTKTKRLEKCQKENK